MSSNILSEIKLHSEIRAVSKSHEEEVLCDGMKSEFKLNKRPFEVIASLVEASNDESPETIIKLEEGTDYQLDYKNHRIKFEKTYSEGQKIHIRWEESKMRTSRIKEPGFLRILGNEDLKESAQKHYEIDPMKIDSHKNEFKWHQIVRLANDIDNYKYMYEKFLSLLLKHRRHHKDFFKLKTEYGTFYEPDFLASTSRLIILAKEFFIIYSNILKKTNFDYPKKNYSGEVLRGTINWQKTIVNSNATIPTKFFTTIPYRKFDTPENMLVVFCLHIIYRESKKILRINSNELIENNLKDSLSDICDKSEYLIKKFPFPKIIGLSKKFWNMEISDRQIRLLINESDTRLKKNVIRNKTYKKVIEWVQKFNELDLSFADQENKTNYPLSSIKSLDTIYEAWIFFTIYDYLKKKNFHPFLKLSSKTKDGYEAYFDLQIKGKIVTFFYEKVYNQKGKNVLVASQKPDLTVECDDQVLIILDAKNYTNLKAANDVRLKMLGYMINGGCNFGALIFPNDPKLDLSRKKESKRKIRKFLEEKDPRLSIPKYEKEREKKINELIKNPDLELMGKHCIESYETPDNSVFDDCTYMEMKLEPKKEHTSENEFVMDRLIKIIIEQI